MQHFLRVCLMAAVAAVALAGPFNKYTDVLEAFKSSIKVLDAPTLATTFQRDGVWELSETDTLTGRQEISTHFQQLFDQVKPLGDITVRFDVKINELSSVDPSVINAVADCNLVVTTDQGMNVVDEKSSCVFIFKQEANIGWLVSRLTQRIKH